MANAKRKARLREEQKGLCFYCYVRMTPFESPDQETIDHRLPRSKGGLTEAINVVLACATCNKAKADMTEEEFLKSDRMASILKMRENYMWFHKKYCGYEGEEYGEKVSDRRV